MIYDNVQPGTEITRLMLFPTPQGLATNVGSIRGYTMHADNTAVNKLRNTIDRKGGLIPLSKNEIASDFSSLVKLNQFKVGDADIVNGWGTNRIRFMLETVEQHNAGSRTIHFFNGYTSYYDGSMDKLTSGHYSIQSLIPMNMEFHINSITSINAIKDSNGIERYNLISKVNVIKNLNGEVTYSIDGVEKTTMSASDLFTELSLEQQYQDVNISGVSTPNEERLTNMREVNSVDYTSSIVNGLIRSKAGMSNEDLTRLNESEKSIHILDGASKKESNHKFGKYGFFIELYKLTGNSKPAFFTLGDLLKIDYNLDNKVSTKVVTSNQVSGLNTQILQSNDLSDSGGSSAAAVKATEFLYMLTPILFDRNINNATLFVSNEHNDGMGSTIAGNVLKATSDVHEIFASPAAFAGIEQSLVNEVIPKLEEREGFNDYVRFTIMADISTTGLSSISIDLFGQGRPEIFRFDSSCDSLTNPLINNMQGKNALINDVKNIVDII